MQVSPRDGENAIINVLRYYEAPNAIVFANTRAMVNRLTTRLSNRGFSVVSLSGELSQAERTHALQAMRDGRARVCVATDVAARGIDLPNLDLVVHAELPNSHETLLHRSGRTGRAGRKGVSALIVPPKSRRKAERLLKSAKLTPEFCAAPSADEVNARDEERMLAESAWSDPVTESEQPSIEKLLAAFSPEQVAAAYLRLYKDRHSAPEELSDATQERSKPRPKSDFGASVWFSVDGGRAAGAEPRRILPMLCKAGGLSKDDIGAIRITQDKSFVQILATSVDAFLAEIGPEMTVEHGARLARVEGTPDLPPERPSFGGKPKPRKPHAPHRKGDKPRYEDKPRHDDKPRTKRPPKPEQTRPEGVVTPAKPRRKPKDGDKPKGPPPPKGKPNSKKNKARAAATKATKGAHGKGGGAKPKRHRP
jgi:ATP-dependent RNA helicase DeaD